MSNGLKLKLQRNITCSCIKVRHRICIRSEWKGKEELNDLKMLLSLDFEKLCKITRKNKKGGT